MNQMTILSDMEFRPAEDHKNFITKKKSQKRNSISKKRKEAIYERDGYKCLICGAIDDLTIDHIIPWSISKDSSESNLQTLCRPCNQNKGDSIPESHPLRNPSLIERAMNVIDDYLNAGNKEERRLASLKAKEVYKAYYGQDYANRNER